MRIIYCLFLVILIGISNSVYAQDSDSIAYLTIQDTIFIEFGEYQEKLLLHKIQPKQTLFSLAQFYGLNLDELFYYNPDLQGKLISVGTEVTIPIPNRAIKRYKTKNFNGFDHLPVFYKIRPGDNLYRISRIHFKMPVDSVMKRNNLKDHNIKPGQSLQLGWMHIDGIPSSMRKFRGSPLHKKNQLNKRKFQQHGHVKKRYSEQGKAYFQKGIKQKTDLYVLHRTATQNSIISITNPLTKRTVYARVIGRIQDSVHGTDVMLVVSNEVAKQLGALNAFFFVKASYYK